MDVLRGDLVCLLQGSSISTQPCGQLQERETHTRDARELVRVAQGKACSNPLLKCSRFNSSPRCFQRTRALGRCVRRRQQRPRRVRRAPDTRRSSNAPVRRTASRSLCTRHNRFDTMKTQVSDPTQSADDALLHQRQGPAQTRPQLFTERLGVARISPHRRARECTKSVFCRPDPVLQSLRLLLNRQRSFPLSNTSRSVSVRYAFIPSVRLARCVPGR